MNRIGVLGGSRAPPGSAEYDAARAIGREIALRGGVVVCGGYGGVMEAACRGAAENGGGSIGIVLAGRGDPNRWVSRSEIAPDLGTRLRRLRDEPRAWIVLPHGLGTLLEIAWITESIAKGESAPRPLVFLGDFWRALASTMLEEAAGPQRDALSRSLAWAETPAEAADLAFRKVERLGPARS
ncbi:MAG TPA: LOG family protein [Thermoanaerobaculia bacterium]